MFGAFAFAFASAPVLIAHGHAFPIQGLPDVWAQALPKHATGATVASKTLPSHVAPVKPKTKPVVRVPLPLPLHAMQDRALTTLTARALTTLYRPVRSMLWCPSPTTLSTTCT